MSMRSWSDGSRARRNGIASLHNLAGVTNVRGISAQKRLRLPPPWEGGGGDIEQLQLHLSGAFSFTFSVFSNVVVEPPTTIPLVSMVGVQMELEVDHVTNASLDGFAREYRLRGS